MTSGPDTDPLGSTSGSCPSPGGQGLKEQEREQEQEQVQEQEQEQENEQDDEICRLSCD